MSTFNKPIVNANLATYQRIYAVSAKEHTDARLLKDWWEKAGLSSEVDVDFIGPHTLHNKPATALNIGQRFREVGNILFVVIDGGKSVLDFIACIKDYQAAFMRYHVVKLENGKFIDMNMPDVEFSFHYEPLPVNEDPNVIEQKEHYVDPLKTMTWNDAKNKLILTGGPVRRLSMGPLAFVGFNQGKVLEADKFWVPANKLAAERNGGTLKVLPYYTMCDGESVDMAWRPSMQDELATDWVDANLFLTLMAFEEENFGKYKATYMLQPGSINTSGTVMFSLYDFLSKKKTSDVLIVTSDRTCANLLATLMSDMKAKLYSTSGDVVANTIIQHGKVNINPELINVDYLYPTIQAEGEIGFGNYDILVRSIKRAMIENPDLSVVVDLKGLTEETDLIGLLGHQKVNELAVDLANKLRETLGEFAQDYPNNWAIVDIDFEAHSE